jgi:hypothetical protein
VVCRFGTRMGKCCVFLQILLGELEWKCHMTWREAGHRSIEIRDMLRGFNSFTFLRLDDLGRFRTGVGNGTKRGKWE